MDGSSSSYIPNSRTCLDPFNFLHEDDVIKPPEICKPCLKSRVSDDGVPAGPTPGYVGMPVRVDGALNMHLAAYLRGAVDAVATLAEEYREFGTTHYPPDELKFALDQFHEAQQLTQQLLNKIVETRNILHHCYCFKYLEEACYTAPSPSPEDRPLSQDASQ